MTTQLEIPSRFCGPPRSGNGGYSCGLIAEQLEGTRVPIEVTLRAPPPLDTPLTWAPDAQGGGKLLHAEQLIAEAVPTSVQIDVPAPVDAAQAALAEHAYIGHRDHPYPTCFVCGPERAEHDGLRLFTGAVAGRPLVAARFVPDASLCAADGSLALRYVWSALDCPSWFGYASFAGSLPTVLLGRLAVEVLRAPRAAEACVVTGWSSGREGRRISCGSALFAADGSCLARSRSTWIVLERR